MSFNQQVYALVRRIPAGRVLSYGRVALLLGVPRGARSVGWALGSLTGPEPEVPWHRVVNAQGRISIKGSPDVAARQRAKLEAEGVVFDDNDTIAMNKFLWQPSALDVEAIIQHARDQARGGENDG